jgi:MFS family permease
VASLLTMGISTVAIGLLPTMKPSAFWRRCCWRWRVLVRVWGWVVNGAARRCWRPKTPRRASALYGSFPQLGAPIGFFFANGTFLLLSWLLTDEQFMSWGWRIPFIFSAVLVLIGLYVRVSLHEPGVRQSGRGEKTGESPAGYAADQTRPRDRAGHVHHAGDLYAVLHHDRLLHDVQHRRRACWAGLPRNEVLWMLMMAVLVLA